MNTTKAPSPAAKKKSKAAQKKLFVLDTSVILYDHNSIDNFQEHDIAIPITVLEELDEFKKGSDTKNFEARQFIRYLDQKAGSRSLQDWNSLNGGTKGKFKVVMNPGAGDVDATNVFGSSKNDHKILNAALMLAEQEQNHSVILVTKDINLRLKAKALNITAQDYETGKIKDVDSLYTGKTYFEDFPQEIVDLLYKQRSIPVDEVVEAETRFKPSNNHFYILKASKSSTLAYYRAATQTLDQLEKKSYYGIKPRNAEQTFALQAIADPEIKLVTISGVAGTGWRVPWSNAGSSSRFIWPDLSCLSAIRISVTCPAI